MTMTTAATACSLEDYLVLPDHSMDDRVAAARGVLGRECVILGHHYQRDEVIRFADFRGDSYKLAQQAAHAEGKYIVFCGVHFMAESADILKPPRPGNHSARFERWLLHGRYGGNFPGRKLLGATRCRLIDR